MGQRNAANPRQTVKFQVSPTQMRICDRVRWQGEGKSELVYRLITSWLQSDRPPLIHPIEKQDEERFSEAVTVRLLPEHQALLAQEAQQRTLSQGQVLRDWLTCGVQVAKLETIKTSHELWLHLEEAYDTSSPIGLRSTLADLEQVMNYSQAIAWLWELKEDGKIDLIYKSGDTLDFVTVGPDQKRFTCLILNPAASKAS